ncbi:MULTISPECIES: BlaI/MecI/CopY family transcriptional regulator [Acidobacterium]|uniref:MarR family transcriptional regulatory protein n=1 Tax=Acidobacterium capsulatum (strain ATCC 51196 / DSM 11244 / BCRC 80197 / JCM 7670 / NBRC 15755 / NCIMB 13165 / 161) TaxID=240015 RepID=C1F3S0_ACIC5|nr:MULTISPECIES: BlaI/MecI/CopY family transcriptional regulator [Acidobacterium]ACO34052.1 MarR family transcriptional regulatory protein [Acidobacterium capsulatum ATCC 51196]HCT60553.1 BlaI/MecI/CopY family transcriptional regulator [Acidobacterium sp.]
MPKREAETLTRLELQIMQVIWKLGSANVTAVQAALEHPLAYTTVQTMLNILHRKGKLRRKLEGRSYVYRAAVSESKATGHAVRDLIDRVFGGSTEALVMSLIKNRQIDADKLAELTRKLEAGKGEEEDQ